MLNQDWWERATVSIPGGVNSPVRAFKSVGGTPRFIDRADGPYMWDCEGRHYIDLICSWGPMILGHRHPAVMTAVREAVENGFTYGAPTTGEVLLAEEIRKLIPSIEQVRLVSSGTEATMSALRLARAYTGRSRIIKFEGCYHGHSDGLLVKAGSGLLSLGQPSSAGIPESVASQTHVLEYNNCDELIRTFQSIGDQIAAVIIEPVAGNMNLVQATPQFLSTLRNLCTRHGSVLIFDEVMCGFRVALGGAQSLYQIKPDVTCLGKVIGGGMPAAAFGGRRDIMDLLAPTGRVYQAGTLSGNPIAVAAGLATLKEIQREGFYEQLSTAAARLAHGFVESASRHGDIPFCADHLGSMFGIYAAPKVPRNSTEVLAADSVLFGRLFHALLQQGVYVAPSAFEAGFVSSAHNARVIDSALEKIDTAFRALAKNS